MTVLGDASALEAGIIISCTCFAFVSKFTGLKYVNPLCFEHCGAHWLRFCREGQDKALLQVTFMVKSCGLQKHLLSLTRMHNKLGLQHHKYLLHFILLYKSIEFDISWGAGRGSTVAQVLQEGPFVAHVSEVNSWVSNLT